MFQAGDPVTALCPWDNSEERPGCVFGRDGQCKMTIFLGGTMCQLEDVNWMFL